MATRALGDARNSARTEAIAPTERRTNSARGGPSWPLIEQKSIGRAYAPNKPLDVSGLITLPWAGILRDARTVRGTLACPDGDMQPEHTLADLAIAREATTRGWRLHPEG